MVKAIQEAGGKAAAVKANVSKPDEVTALFKESLEAFPEDKIEVGGKVGQDAVCKPGKRAAATK